MWQRVLVAVICLSAVAILLMMSSNSRVEKTSKASSAFLPVVVDTMPTEAEDAQILQLHMEARNAMRTLMAKHTNSTISAKK
jgi:hypothetical protein